MDGPIAGAEESSQSPFGDLPGAPARQFVQRFAARIDGLHDDEPTENQSVLALPHAGHAVKHGGDERGQIGQDEHGLSPCKLARESRMSRDVG
jgi:hypothetical protein